MNIIEGLTTLNERWPGFFMFLKVANGYGGEMDYEEFMELNKKIIEDDEGKKLFVELMAQTMSGNMSPEEDEFWREHCFLTPKLQEFEGRIVALNERLADPDSISIEERKELRKEFNELKAQAQKAQAGSLMQIAKGFEQMKHLS